MRLAADRDGIAREYATAFDATFGIGVPALETRTRREGSPGTTRSSRRFLTLLAAAPDTHVARRGGTGVGCRDLAARPHGAPGAGGVRSTAGPPRDRRDGSAGCAMRSNVGNPGTTADLTAAAIFVVLLGGGWPRPGQA